jgi:hypothetical protein
VYLNSKLKEGLTSLKERREREKILKKNKKAPFSIRHFLAMNSNNKLPKQDNTDTFNQ